MSRYPKLAGKVALVTGASGWIGSAIAKRLGASGASVVVNYYSHEAKAQEVVDDIVQKGGAARAIRADVADEQQVKNLVAEVLKLYGPIEIVVNNALKSGPGNTRVEDQKWDYYLIHMDTSVKAPLLILQAVLPEMKSRGYGRIINIGSQTVELGLPEDAHYCSAKGAMLAQTRVWANELGPWGITVNLVAPGWIPGEGHGFQNGEMIPELESYLKEVPLRQYGTPGRCGGGSRIPGK